MGRYLDSKFIKFFIISIVSIFIFSCVPKATEKKAVCGTNEAFNNITRTCYSIEATKYLPVANLSSLTTNQETPKLVELTYSDKNKDAALSCTLSGVDANLSMISPLLIDGLMATQLEDLKGNLTNLKNAMYYYRLAYGSVIGSAITADNAVGGSGGYLDDYTKNYFLFLGSKSINNINSYVLTMENDVKYALDVVKEFKSVDFNLNFYSIATQKSLDTLDATFTLSQAKCYCVGGICKTYMIPKKGFYGNAGFSYSVTDKDGDSNLSAVNVAVTANSKALTYLLPTVESVYVEGVESITSTPSQYPFTLGIGRDYFFTTNLIYSPISSPKAATVISGYSSSAVTYVDSDNGLGRITGCMGLGGSSVSDTTCIYIPKDGDTFEALTPAVAEVTTLNGINFKAKAKGTGGNDTKIYFVDINSDVTGIDSYSSQIEKFGLIGNDQEVYVRVLGNIIYVIFHEGVTQNSDIISAINNDVVANRLVDASATNGATLIALAKLSDASGSITLGNSTHAASFVLGAGGYDEFSYYVSNGYGVSYNTSKATIHITSSNDTPLVPREYIASYFAPTTTFVEDTAAQGISVPFKDVDTSAGFVITAKIDPVGTSCTTITLADFNSMTTSTNFTIDVSAPTITYNSSNHEGSAAFTVTTNSDFAGSGCLYYKVNDASIDSNVQGMPIVVQAVNDAPTMALTSFGVNPLPLDGISGAISNIKMDENSSTVSTSAFVCFSAATGGGSDESTGTTKQTLTATPSYLNSSDANLQLAFTLKNPGVTGNTCVSGEYMLTWVPTKNHSGTIDIKIYVEDNGKSWNGTALVSNPQSVYETIHLTVNAYNDPPVITTAVTSASTNEGGYVIAGPFYIDEDAANSTDENKDGIKISFVSDNQTVLMDSNITMFYDLNDNGIEDTGESRVSSTDASPVLLEGAAPANLNDSHAHAFYLKLSPVAGTSGSANITLKAKEDGNSLIKPLNNETTYSFALIVNSVAAIHGGWTNISSTGLKLDKNNLPALSSDIACNYNKVTETNKCMVKVGSGTAVAADCKGIYAPYDSGTFSVTTDAPNVIYYDSSAQKCYVSYYNNTTSTYLWKQFNTTCPVTRSVDNCGQGGNCIFPKYIPSAATVTSALVNTYCGGTNTSLASFDSGTPTAVSAVADAGKIYYDTNAKLCWYSNLVAGSSTVYEWTNHATPTAANQFYYEGSSCYKSNQSASTITWETEAYTPAKVKLTWKPFTLSSSGIDYLDSIKGYNVYRRETGSDYDYRTGQLIPAGSTSSMSVPNASTLTFTDSTAVAGKVYYYTVRPVDTNHNFSTYTPEIFSEVRIIAPRPNYAFVHRWMINQEVCNKMHMTTATTNQVQPAKNFRCPFYGMGASQDATGNRYYDYGKDLLVDITEVGCPYTQVTSIPARCSNGTNGCIGIGNPNDVSLTSVGSNDIYYDRESGSCYIHDGTSWIDYNDLSTATLVSSNLEHNSSLNAPLVNITEAKAEFICENRTVPTIKINSSSQVAITNMTLPEKKDYIAYSAPSETLTSESLIADLEQGDSINQNSRCNSSNASGLEGYYTDSDLPTSSYIYTLPGTYSSRIRSIYTGSVPLGFNKSTTDCSSRYGIQDIYGNVAEWTKDKMKCGSTGTKICTAETGTAIGDYKLNSISSKTYAFDLYTGPYNDSSGSGQAGDSTIDSFLTSWKFEDETFDATKFSFPTAMPFFTNYASLISCPFSGPGANCTNGTLGCIGTSDPSTVVSGNVGDYYLDQATGKCYQSTGAQTWNEVNLSAPLSAGVDFIMDIGSTSGLTYSQLHGDGMIINGANIYNASATHIGSFAVGGSYLSGSMAGRFTSELIPSDDIRPDVGFRCIIPIDKADYGVQDTFHHYNYGTDLLDPTP
jgi:hypothetical protein